jgi:hypothetical protein
MIPVCDHNDAGSQEKVEHRAAMTGGDELAVARGAHVDPVDIRLRLDPDRPREPHFIPETELFLLDALPKTPFQKPLLIKMGKRSLNRCNGKKKYIYIYIYIIYIFCLRVAMGFAPSPRRF